jgi:hypothetical protein
MAMSIEQLPDNVLHTIASLLAQTDKMYRRQSDVGRDAFSLLATGGRACRRLAEDVFEALEPGCVAAHEQRHAEMVAARVAAAIVPDEPLMPLASPTDKADVLRAACVAAGCRRSTGSKAQLWDALTTRMEELRKAWRGKVAEAEKVCGSPLAPPSRCPLSATFLWGLKYDARERMCASRAKDEYQVTEKDLAPLSYVGKKSPYRGGAPMRMYLLRDVARVALARHGGDAEGHRRRKHATSLRLKDNKSRLRKERVAALDVAVGDPARLVELVNYSTEASQEREAFVSGGKRRSLEQVSSYLRGAIGRMVGLRDALSVRGCALRADSELCLEYVHVGGDLGEVVDVMEEMSFHFEHTSYRTRVRDIMSEALRRDDDYGCRDRDRDDWLDEDEMSDLRIEASHEARAEAMDEWLRTHDTSEYDLPANFRRRIAEMG